MKLALTSYSLGVELQKEAGVAALVSLSRGKKRVEALYSLNAQGSPQQLYSTEKSQGLEVYQAKAVLVSSLASSAVLVRSLETPPIRKADLPSVVRYQAEPLLPFPSDDAILGYSLVRETSQGQHFSLLATRKEQVAKHLESLAVFGLEPDIVSSTPIALSYFADNYYPSYSQLMIVHIGETETTCALLEDHRMIASYSLLTGTENLLLALAKDRPEKNKEKEALLAGMDAIALSKEEFPSLSKEFENVINEIKRAFYTLRKSCQRQGTNAFQASLLLTGQGCFISRLQELLATSLSLPSAAATASEGISLESLLCQAVPIGLALEGFDSSASTLNFRQAEFTYPHPWKRILKPLQILALLCATISLLLFFSGKLYIDSRLDDLRLSYGKLILSSGSTLEGFEETYRSKNKLPPLSSEKSLSLRDYSLEAITARLAYFEKQIKGAPDCFPLQPNTPRVSDFLAWLSTHPNVSRAKEDGSREALIQLQSLNYTLVKRPDHGKKKERYQVRVDFEFTAVSPKEARQFHDALIEPNDMVDAAGEVKWNTSRTGYHTSFFLKDKTTYSIPALRGAR